MESRDGHLRTYALPERVPPPVERLGTREHMDAATFRKLGHDLIEWVAEYRERVERLPVMSP
jgi:hypothetical protein